MLETPVGFSHPPSRSNFNRASYGGFCSPRRTNFWASFKGQPGRLLEAAGAHLSLRSAAATAPGVPVAAAEFSLVPREPAETGSLQRLDGGTGRRDQRDHGAARERKCGDAQPAGLRAAGGSGQRLGLGLGCRGGGHRSGGSGASRLRVR